MPDDLFPHPMNRFFRCRGFSFAMFFLTVSTGLAGDIRITGTFREGTPIPTHNYRVVSRYLALTTVQSAADGHEAIRDFVLEIEHKPADCREERCQVHVIYSLPRNTILVDRDKGPGRGQVFVNHGGRRHILGSLTGLGQREWVSLDSGRQIDANHEGVSLMIRNVNEAEGIQELSAPFSVPDDADLRTTPDESRFGR